jgi:hypothetical protein
LLLTYVLSTLTNNLGHLFEEFDENTSTELHAWQGKLVQKNLHLRKDALKQLGMPPLPLDTDDKLDDDIED